MEESTIINSEYVGSWANPEIVTSKLTDNMKYKLYINAIKRYMIEMNINEEDKNKEFSSSQNKTELNLPPNISQFDILKNRKYSKKIHLWRGIVTVIKNSSFSAHLEDLTDGGTEEVAEFEIEDISPEDKSLFKVGSSFYWSVGYYIENGQIFKKSQIRFQRLVVLTEHDINSALDKVDLLINRIKFK